MVIGGGGRGVVPPAPGAKRSNIRPPTAPPDFHYFTIDLGIIDRFRQENITCHIVTNKITENRITIDALNVSHTVLNLNNGA